MTSKDIAGIMGCSLNVPVVSKTSEQAAEQALRLVPAFRRAQMVDSPPVLTPMISSLSVASPETM
jgi:hypothetical protein